MSIVVGLAVGKHRIIGGDQRASYDDGHKFDKSPKVYKIKTGLVGFTGETVAESKLIETLRKADDPTLDSVALPKGEYRALFMSRNGKVYDIVGGKAAACEKGAVVFCAGAAYQYAHGAIYGYCKAKRWTISRVNKTQLTELVRLGCRVAIEMNNTCGGRIQVKHLEVA